MKIEILVTGKTKTDFFKKGIEAYLCRLLHYVPCALVELPDVKVTAAKGEAGQKIAEGKQMMSYFEQSDTVVLLDERGTQFSSREFAGFMQKRMASGAKRLLFVVGGTYGFSDEVYQRADYKMSLSRMTFPHDMVRLIFVEQLYRAMSILRNEPYHHD